MTRTILLALLVAAAPVLAATAFNVDSIAGLYTSAPPNARTDSGKANNVLEVVKLTPSKAYMRTHLEIGTAICAYSGIMRIEGAELVGREQTDFGTCELHVTFTDGKVRFADKNWVCSRYDCGVAGDFGGAEFSMKSRRPITYMKRLLASRQYQDAIRSPEGK